LFEPDPITSDRFSGANAAPDPDMRLDVGVGVAESIRMSDFAARRVVDENGSFIQ
jgi:hypothetical protein